MAGEFVYLAVVIDRYSRKVIGWSLSRSLAVRLTLAALNQAIENRQPPPGLVHHSDRGVQYASREYVELLKSHDITPSMSRAANPYDNAACESFMKTLKYEEIHCRSYSNLEELAANREEFIDQYYNRQRLHSALGYRSPEEFEALAPRHPAATETMSFLGHGEIYPSDSAQKNGEESDRDPSPAHRLNESPVGYSSAGCSPAEQAYASPTKPDSALTELN